MSNISLIPGISSSSTSNPNTPNPPVDGVDAIARDLIKRELESISQQAEPFFKRVKVDPVIDEEEQIEEARPGKREREDMEEAFSSLRVAMEILSLKRTKPGEVSEQASSTGAFRKRPNEEPEILEGVNSGRKKRHNTNESLKRERLGDKPTENPEAKRNYTLNVRRDIRIHWEKILAFCEKENIPKRLLEICHEWIGACHPSWTKLEVLKELDNNCGALQRLSCLVSKQGIAIESVAIKLKAWQNITSSLYHFVGMFARHVENQKGSQSLEVLAPWLVPDRNIRYLR